MSTIIRIDTINCLNCMDLIKPEKWKRWANIVEMHAVILRMIKLIIANIEYNIVLFVVRTATLVFTSKKEQRLN